MNISQKDIKTSISLLEKLINNSALLADLSDEQRISLMKAAGQLTRPDRAAIKKRNKAKRKIKRKSITDAERISRENTGIRTARQNSVFTAPAQLNYPDKNEPVIELNSPRNCYICKEEYTKLHFFYDSICKKCADFNYQKRFQTADLNGQVALITGSRLKIGYQATLMMLRAGATVIATTRFPVDSALRYANENDFNKWQSRLHIYGLDLRHTPSVEIFTKFIIQNYDRLDLLINNAAQTVRRPPGFYKHLMDNELLPHHKLSKEVNSLLHYHRECITRLNSVIPQKNLIEKNNNSDLPVAWDEKLPGIGLHSSAKLSQIPYTHDNTLSVEQVFPDGKLDVDLQQVDLRETNSWRLQLGEIQTSEMIELQLINSIAPFVLCNKLIPLMKQDNTGQKHIVNVSAMEGKFMRFKKDSRHPHTNMAKAALNMLTHTSAGDLAKCGIYVNAVDTGWVTDEDPAHLVKFKQEKHDFQPPLDIVDGAARVCDPFFDGINTGKHWSGKFLKDYFPIDW